MRYILTVFSCWYLFMSFVSIAIQHEAESGKTVVINHQDREINE